MNSLKIKTATAADKDPIIKTITQAFSTDPAARWIFPEAQQYMKCFPSFIEAFAGRAFERGNVDCVNDYSGAALWLSPGIHPDEAAVATLLQHNISERDQERVFALFEQMEKYHPAEPHWYLPMIGVEPAKQGNGYGSALLKHALQRCDSDNKLAYLEASSAQTIPLYERHGFEVLGTLQVGCSPSLFPMTRKPGGSHFDE